MPRTSVRYRASRTDKAVGCGFLLVWGGALLGTIAFWGVVIWAIVKLVSHYT